MAGIDWGSLALGSLVGLGCRRQLKAAGRVVAQTAASLAGVAAATAEQVAEETKESSQPSPQGEAKA